MSGWRAISIEKYASRVRPRNGPIVLAVAKGMGVLLVMRRSSQIGVLRSFYIII